MSDRTSAVFGNDMPASVRDKARKSKDRYQAKFGPKKGDPLSGGDELLYAKDNPILGPEFGVQTLALGNAEEAGAGLPLNSEKGVVVGTIRMGYGHYRIAMSVASALKHRGYTPYWFDLNGFDRSVGGRVVLRLNELYSLGSRLSQQYALFNRLYWEPLNAEGFKKLSFNAVDQRVAELFAPLYRGLPPAMPFIATHAWPAQGALHAGMAKVVNMIPDNWPMALHLSEGALHAVQSPSAYLGYRVLREMKGDGSLSLPMPASSLRMTGHFVDHELVANLGADTARRMARIERGQPKRVLFSIGGAGAQLDLIVALVKELLPRVLGGKLALYLNFGDHAASWERFVAALGADATAFESLLSRHFGDWPSCKAFAAEALDGQALGVHAFLNADKFAAVYCTNLLMRSADILVTKPGELAYYPIPKLMIQRVGGHERWGAIRAAELGDGSYELESLASAAQVLHLMLEECDILSLYNERILKNAAAGVYDGAYKAVDMALGSC
jgi:UDP-N-acetylglucosamine:LPS N-acetylglucosamine transferase